jgi:hypothetical protein
MGKIYFLNYDMQIIREILAHLATWSTSCVWSRRFLPGSRKSQILFCELLTATPLPTHSEHNTSRTFGSRPCFSSREMITLMCSSWNKCNTLLSSTCNSIKADPFCVNVLPFVHKNYNSRTVQWNVLIMNFSKSHYTFASPLVSCYAKETKSAILV